MKVVKKAKLLKISKISVEIKRKKSEKSSTNSSLKKLLLRQQYERIIQNHKEKQCINVLHCAKSVWIRSFYILCFPVFDYQLVDIML